MQKKQGWINGAHQIRDDLLGAIDDTDLELNPGGANKTLGGLLNGLIDIEKAYVDSFEHLSLDLVTVPDSQLSGLRSIRDELASLDSRLNAMFETWSEDDYTTSISRSDGFKVSRADQLEIYMQAVLIVVAQMVVYVRSAEIEIPQSAETWIG